MTPQTPSLLGTVLPGNTGSGRVVYLVTACTTARP